MDIEDIHKYAYFKRLAIGVDILGFFDGDDASVGRRQHVELAVGSATAGIAKKLQHKQREQPERNRSPARPKADQYGNKHDARQKRPTLTGDDGGGGRGSY